MDLQTIGCKAVTSANAWLAITSVRIPHKQPSPTGANRTLPGACPLPLVVAIEGRVCRLSPVYPPTDAYSLRVKAKPSIEVRESLGPAWLGLNDAVSSDQIRVAVSKLLATSRAKPSAELIYVL